MSFELNNEVERVNGMWWRRSSAPEQASSMQPNYEFTGHQFFYGPVAMLRMVRRAK